MMVCALLMPPTDLKKSIEDTPNEDRPSLRWGVILVFGLILCQALLFFPSFSGRKLLTATDIAIAQGALGRSVAPKDAIPQNALSMDLVQVYCPGNDFAARSIKAGRLPLWNPYIYCGSPFLPTSVLFSPFSLIYHCWNDPTALVWIHLVKSLVAGIGAYLFLRKIGSSRWAATIGAWCFPLIGFMVVWLTHFLSPVAAWMPWGFLAVEFMVRRPRGWGGPALAALIGLIVVSGSLETGAHVLVAIGVYGIWRWTETHRAEKHTVLVAAIAMAIGLGLGAIQLLPTAAYAHSGYRMLQRAQGIHDDPHSFSATAPEAIRVLFPYLLGSRQAGSHEVSLASMVFNEGGPQGSIGFTLLVLLVPICVLAHWRKSSTWFWMLLALCAAAPMFRIPLFNLWENIPPFDVTRNGRALLLTAWSLLVLGVKGLDLLAHPERVNRPTAIAVTLFAAICAGGFLFVFQSPPTFLVKAYTVEAWPWFQTRLMECALITGAGAGLMRIWLTAGRRARGVARAIGLLAVGELVLNAWGYNPQVSRDTYYPSRGFISYLQEHAGTGRILGMGGVLYPNLSMEYGLRDIRGYDGIDPLPYVSLLSAAKPHASMSPSYAMSMYFVSGPSPVLDLLGVRYIVAPISLDAPPWEEVFRSDGFWIYRNPGALERAFIPRNAEYVPGEAERCKRLGESTFDPRDLVLISKNFPPLSGIASGEVNIVEDSAEKILIRANCATDAIVVLADSWAPGWGVKIDNHPAEALQANHALRAVRVPAGEHFVEWVYAPADVYRALWISISALAALVLWSLYVAISNRPQSA